MGGSCESSPHARVTLLPVPSNGSPALFSCISLLSGPVLFLVVTSGGGGDDDDDDEPDDNDDETDDDNHEEEEEEEEHVIFCFFSCLSFSSLRAALLVDRTYLIIINNNFNLQ